MKKEWSAFARALIIALLLLLIVGAVFLYFTFSEFHNQLIYLQDTTNVILSDVSGLESGIAKTLQKETGRIEDYSISFSGMNLKKKTYDVEIQVVPREFTDQTKVSVYLGTYVCKLVKKGYVYQGSMSLPLDNSFDGNLTFLFEDGKKKTTEIYSDYHGIQTNLDQVLSASFMGEAKMEGNRLNVDGNLTYWLDGGSLFSFDSLKLLMVCGEEEYVISDYLDEKTDGFSGEETVAIDEAIEQPGTVRMLLRASTTEGYRFEHQFMEAEVEADGSEGLEGEKTLMLEDTNVDWTNRTTVFDAEGGTFIVE